MELLQIFFIAVGGFFGAISRAFVSQLSGNKEEVQFPFSTLSVNLAGCFLLGLVLPHAAITFYFQDLIIIGFLGALTTFSTLVMELDSLWERKRSLAIKYGLASIGIGLIILRIGIQLGQFAIL